MSEVLFGFLLGTIVFFFGYATADDNHLDKCVAKYSDMPHNKVEPFCKELLKFNKDSTSTNK